MPTRPDLTPTSGRRPSRRLLRLSVMVVAGTVGVMLPLVALVQPETTFLAIRAGLVVVGLGVLALWLDFLGYRRGGAAVFVAGLILLVGLNGLTTGGIRSPGIQAWFVVMLLAGVLLGLRAGLVVAVATALLSLGLVLAESGGHLPPPAFEYEPIARWLITLIYLSLATFLLWLGIATTRAALDRARAELVSRRQVEQRLDQALSAGMIGTFEHDLTSNLLFPDDRAVALTGLLPDADGRVPLEAWRTQVVPEDLEELEETLGQFIERRLGGRVAYRYRHPVTGALRHLEAALYVAHEPGERARSMIGMLTDVTVREEAIRERNRVVVDLKERLKELSALHAFVTLLQENDRVDGQRLRQLATSLQGAMQFPDLAAVRVSLGDVEGTSPGWPADPPLMRSNLNTSAGAGMIEIGYRPFPHDSPVPRFLPEEEALLASATEMLRAHIARAAAEADRTRFETQLRQSEKMSALGRLAGGIAHDFNNILTGLTQHADLAAQGLRTEDPIRSHMQAIQVAAGRGRDLVRQIMDFSRQRDLRLQPTDLAPMLDEVAGLLRARLQEGIAIEVVAEPDLPRVSVDPGRIHQVLMNLGTNAIQAMAAAGGVLRFEAARTIITDAHQAPAVTLRTGTYVLLTVSDTGPGIPPHLIDRLFEPFFTTKGDHGTGLGLALVHGIVIDHGGAILVESDLGVGSRFHVFLPTANTGQVAAVAEPAGLPRGQGELVLVVDDDAEIRAATSRILEWLGYRCHLEASAEEALTFLAGADSGPAAILSDLNMPGMDGAALCDVIRASHPGIPMAIMSGDTTTRSRGGDVVWIPKPASLAELADALARMLG